jgi:HK97 family phage major capsid protein
MSLKELQNERLELVKANRRILDKAAEEKRPLSSEEEQEYARIDGELDACEAKIAAIETEQARRDKLAGHQANADKLNDRRVPAGALPGESPKALKFKLGSGRSLNIQPGSEHYARCSPEYQAAFLTYISGGRASLGLQSNINTQGGYLAPIGTMAKLIKFLDNQVFMRQLATVLPPMPDSQGIGVPSLDTDPGDADWTAEVPAADISEDTSMAFGKREFIPHLLTKLIKSSKKLLNVSILDVENLIVERLGYKFAVSEEKAYLTGTGAQQPLGVFTASANGISTGRDKTASATTSWTADDIVDLFYNLKPQYQVNATSIWHRDSIARIRKLKIGTGEYVWQPGLAGGVGNTILGRPYVTSEYAPNTFTTGLYVGIFGDFKTGYWIGDGMNLSIQRLEELFALRNQVGLLGSKETDGAPVLEEAFSRMKLA